MRTINQLLQLMLNYTINNLFLIESYSYGLCEILDEMYNLNRITISEYKTLSVYLSTNLPIRTFSAFSFPIGEKQPRIEWLEEHIQLTSKEASCED